MQVFTDKGTVQDSQTVGGVHKFFQTQLVSRVTQEPQLISDQTLTTLSKEIEKTKRQLGASLYLKSIPICKTILTSSRRLEK